MSTTIEIENMITVGDLAEQLSITRYQANNRAYEERCYGNCK